jgi:hypothetical protein
VRVAELHVVLSVLHPCDGPTAVRVTICNEDCRRRGAFAGGGRPLAAFTPQVVRIEWAILTAGTSCRTASGLREAAALARPISCA